MTANAESMDPFQKKKIYVYIYIYIYISLQIYGLYLLWEWSNWIISRLNMSVPLVIPHRPSRVDWDAEWHAVKSEDQRMSTEMIEADLDVLFANKMIE